MRSNKLVYFAIGLNMDLQLVALQMLCYTSLSFIVFRHSHCITLTLSSNDNLEGRDATLRCSDDGNVLGIVRWSKRDPPQRDQMTIKNSVCATGSVGFLQNSLLYSYDCTDGRVYTVSIKSISSEMNGQIWTCDLGINGAVSNEVVIYVKVPVSTLTINPSNKVIIMSEKTTLSLTCTTSACRPEPKFIWYKDNSVMTDGDETILSQSGGLNFSATNIQTYTSSFTILLTRDLNGWYLFCSADNYIGSSVTSNKIQLNITYPPDRSPSIGNLSNRSQVTVIQGDNIHYECSATGGNPPPVLKWNIFNDSPMNINGNTVTKALSWIATGPDPVDLICQSLHPDRNDIFYVTINVLYPPGPPEIKIKTSSGAYIIVNKTLNVIEGRPFTLNCFAKSNPSVSLYKWNDLLTTNSSVYYNANPGRNIASISCYVSNVMRVSDSSPIVNGNNVTHLQVDVLYPPTINILRDATLVEGENLDDLCNFTNGNPSATKITLSWQGSTWNVNPLQPNFVSRNQTGLYKCTVQNLMVSSEGTQVVGNASGKLHLSVQYKAAILRFAINETNDNINITVNEYDAVNLTCEIEGLPLPTGHLLHQSLFNQKIEELPRYSTFQTTTNIRLQSVFQAQCTDNGIQICSGTNTFYNGFQSTSSKNVSLFVMCKPRKSPYITIPDEVQSPTSVDVTLSFTALAYPIPTKSGYVWTRKDEISDTWVNITADGHYTNISTNELQSNLTIRGVSQLDYGLYRVSIGNDVGHFSHTFNLTHSVYINEDTSSSSHAVEVAAGTVGGVVVLVAVIVIVIVYKRRKAMSTTNEDTSSQYYNLDATKADDNNTPVDGGSSNVYEGLHKTGLDQQYESLSPPACEMEKANGCSSNFYEGLQNKGLDQQYDTLSSSASKIESGNHKAYENLQLTRTTDRHPVGESSEAVKSISKKEHAQTIV